MKSIVMDATRGSILLRTLTRHSTLAFGLIGAAMAISACTTTCRPATTSIQAPAGPPTVWLLVLEVQQGAVRVLDAKPASGRIVTPRLEERAASLRRRESVWIEYSVRSDASKQVLHSGAFAASMTAIVEAGKSGEVPGTIRVGRRVISVAVPYASEPTSITFARVDPADALPIEKWSRVPIGNFALKGAAR